MEDRINYVYNYIKYFFPMIEEIDDDSIKMKLANDIVNKHSTKDFINKDNDFYIDMELRTILKDSKTFKEYSAIKNHIYGLMIYDNCKNKDKIDDYNLLLKEMTKRVYNGFTCEDVISNKCDEAIELMIDRRREYLDILKRREMIHE